MWSKMKVTFYVVKLLKIFNVNAVKLIKPVQRPDQFRSARMIGTI